MNVDSIYNSLTSDELTRLRQLINKDKPTMKVWNEADKTSLNNKIEQLADKASKLSDEIVLDLKLTIKVKPEQSKKDVIHGLKYSGVELYPHITHKLVYADGKRKNTQLDVVSDLIEDNLTDAILDGLEDFFPKFDKELNKINDQLSVLEEEIYTKTQEGLKL